MQTKIIGLSAIHEARLSSFSKIPGPVSRETDFQHLPKLLSLARSSPVSRKGGHRAILFGSRAIGP
jgi:hypothetical protein